MYFHADDCVEGREHVVVAHVGAHIRKRDGPLKLLVLGGERKLLEFPQEERHTALEDGYDVVAEVEALLQRVDVEYHEVQGASATGWYRREDSG